jgi:hypothetical protein
MPGTTKLSRGLRGSCGARPLRPPASLLHNAAFYKVVASRCARAALGFVHRCAPSRVYKTHPMQSTCAGRGHVSRWRSSVASAPYAPPPGRPGGWRDAMASVRRSALWSWCVACGQLPRVCPAHPWASPRFAGLGPALGLPVRPQGAPSAQRGGIYFHPTPQITRNSVKYTALRAVQRRYGANLRHKQKSLLSFP